MDKNNIFPSHAMFEIYMATANLFGRLPSEFIIQLHHQLNHRPKAHRTEKSWIHGSAEEWAKILSVSTKTLERVIKRLVASGVIEKQKRCTDKSNRTNSYSLNYETLRRLIANSCDPINTNIWHWFFGTTNIQAPHTAHQSMASTARVAGSPQRTPESYCQTSNIPAN